MKNTEGKTALDIYCENGADTNSDGFYKLQVEELINIDENTPLSNIWNILISMCDYELELYARKV